MKSTEMVFKCLRDGLFKLLLISHILHLKCAIPVHNDVSLETNLKDINIQSIFYVASV